MRIFLEKMLNILLVLALINIGLCYEDSFDEELLLKPLYNDHIYAHFQFTTRWSVQEDKENSKHLITLIHGVFKYLTKSSFIQLCLI